MVGRAKVGCFRAIRRELGIAVHEHVLDELLGGKAVDRVFIAAGRLWEVGEDLLPIFAGGATPSASWVDHMGLHVEDELVAGERLCGRCGLKRALLGQAKETRSVYCGGRWHSARVAVNRSVAGSSPARGANRFFAA
jgi:hypothetical protein